MAQGNTAPVDIRYETHQLCSTTTKPDKIPPITPLLTKQPNVRHGSDISPSPLYIFRLSCPDQSDDAEDNQAGENHKKGN